MKKFNFNRNKIKIQFTDGSVIFFKLAVKKLILRFEKDVRSLIKWRFRIFKIKTVFFEEKSIEKFRNKFVKYFLS
jgi:hypothetical protein